MFANASWSRVIPKVTNYVNNFTNFASKFVQPTAHFHSLTTEGATQINPGGLFDISTRNVIRVHFPRPSERKRIKRHGWQKRLSTLSGRRVIMNRILKGRFVYTH